MKLIYAIIQDRDSENVIRNLSIKGHSVTRLASTGGFLRYGNVTLLISVEPEDVSDILALMKQNCSPHDSSQHAATIFIVDMPIYHKV